MGMFSKADNEFNKALEFYKKAKSLTPGTASWFKELGEAVTVLQEGVRKYKGVSDDLILLSNIFYAVSMHDPDKFSNEYLPLAAATIYKWKKGRGYTKNRSNGELVYQMVSSELKRKYSLTSDEELEMLLMRLLKECYEPALSIKLSRDKSKDIVGEGLPEWAYTIIECLFLVYFTGKATSKNEAVEVVKSIIKDSIPDDPRFSKFIDWASEMSWQEYKYDWTEASVIFHNLTKGLAERHSEELKKTVLNITAQIVYLYRRGFDTGDIVTRILNNDLPFKKFGQEILSREDYWNVHCKYIKEHLLSKKAIVE